jgi:hypothetical protein
LFSITSVKENLYYMRKICDVPAKSEKPLIHVKANKFTSTTNKLKLGLIMSKGIQKEQFERQNCDKNLALLFL